MSAPLIPSSANFDTLYSRVELVDSLTDGHAILSGGSLSNLYDPVGPKDVATKNYVLSNNTSVTPGTNRTWKTAVRLGTTGTNITLSGIQIIDSILAQIGDTVLVKDQSDTTQNGVYVVSSGSWTRSLDCAVGVQASGMAAFIVSGQVNNGKLYLCNDVSGSNTALNFGSAITYVVYGQSTAGGLNTQVQYNSSNVLAGSSNMTWDGTSFSVIDASTNAIQSITNTSSANLYTSHNNAINIGSQNSQQQSLAANSYGASISLGKVTGGPVYNIGDVSLSGTSVNTANISPAGVSIMAGSATGSADQSGGNVLISSGLGNNATSGGNVTAIADAGGVNGGNLYIYAGTGGGTSLPGSIYLTPGLKNTGGTAGNVVVSTNATGQTIVLSTTNSTSTTSGSMILSGGLGVAKDIYCAGLFGTLGSSSVVLPNGNILIGNGSNVSNPVVVSGDATLSNTGVMALASVTSSGTFSASNITIDAKGRVLTASNGSSSILVSPGGTNSQLQYNNSGAFGGSSDFTYNNNALSGSTSSNFSITSSTLASLNVTNATATGIFIGTLNSAGITSTNLSLSGTFNSANTTSTNVSVTNTTTGGLVTTYMTASALTASSVLVTGTLTSATMTASNLNMTSVTMSNNVTSNLTSTNMNVSSTITSSALNISGTGILTGLVTVTNAIAPSITASNMNITTSTSTSINANLQSTSNTCTNIIATSATGTNLNTTNLTTTNISVSGNSVLPYSTFSNLVSAGPVIASRGISCFSIPNLSMSTSPNGIYTLASGTDSGLLLIYFQNGYYILNYSNNNNQVLVTGLGGGNTISFSSAGNVIGTANASFIASAYILRMS